MRPIFKFETEPGKYEDIPFAFKNPIKIIKKEEIDDFKERSKKKCENDFKQGEITGAFGNAKGMAKYAAIMAGKGTLDGH